MVPDVFLILPIITEFQKKSIFCYYFPPFCGIIFRLTLEFSMFYVCFEQQGVLALKRPDYEKLRTLYFETSIPDDRKKASSFRDEILSQKNTEKTREKAGDLPSAPPVSRNQLAPHTFLDFATFDADSISTRREEVMKRPPLRLDEPEENEEGSVFDVLKAQIFGSLPAAPNESILDEMAAAPIEEGSEVVYDEELEYLDALAHQDVHSLDALTREEDSLGEIFADIVAGERDSAANFEADVFDANIQMIYAEDVDEEASEDGHVDVESDENEDVEVKEGVEVEAGADATVADVPESPVDAIATPVADFPVVQARKRHSFSMIDMALFVIVIGLLGFLIFLHFFN